ncbi:MAG: AAA domain-containing protein [Nitrosomonadales bacterium]|jgi:MoxR-like ATPase|nr:AAA domain-containing protein [Nitrosomonadales bacterium]
MKKYTLPKPSAEKLAQTCLFAGGHLLIEDIPGTGKTVLAKKIANISNLSTNRIQCTNDLMPADILGYNKVKNNKLIFIKGPIFTNILLIDELNRAPSRTQSALLEAMEELQVSIEGKTHSLSKPFFVIATQNPREQTGVFDLPESQIDRFSICIKMDEISNEGYKDILLFKEEKRTDKINFKKVITKSDLIHIDEKLINYLLSIISLIEVKVNKKLAIRPRIQLKNLSKSFAALDKRNFVVPEDIQSVLLPNMRHRLPGMADSELEKILIEVVKEVKIP